MTDPDEKKRMKLIRRTARIWGSFIIVYVAIFLIGSGISLITTGDADPNSEEDVPITEYAGPVLFLLSTIGFGIAFKWEGIGGALVVVFQLLFIISQFIFRGPSMKGSFIFPIILSLFIMLPGLLFVLWWRRNGMPKPRMS